MLHAVSLLLLAADAAAAPDECRSGTLYLTIDTGSMKPAAEIAAILRKHQVKATVFVANEKTWRGDGALDDSQLSWLDGVLSDGAPTLVAMHHPCFAIGGRGLAGVRLDDESVDGLAAVVSRHANVLSVVSGHAHMTLSTSFAGTVAHACPSVAYEFDFRGRDLIYRPGLPRYMLYTWSTGGKGFFAREMTVAPGDSWLVMESF